MSESVFRKKSLENIKSPDNLDQYIQVAHASGWILLLTIMFLLVGALVWGFYGKIESKENVQAFVTDGNAVCTIDSEDFDKISAGMVLRIDNTEGNIWSADKKTNSVTAKINVPDGVYKAVIITEVIKPISLIFD